MTRRAFLEKYLVRFLISLALVGLIVYTVYHVFWNTAESLATDYVRLHEDTPFVVGTGYLFRNESVLTHTGGVIYDRVESGSKVAKDITVAEVYRGYGADEIPSVQMRVDALSRLIAVLEKSIVSPDTTLSKAELYRKEADAIRLDVRKAVQSGEWSGMKALEEEMLILLNRYETLIGKTDALPDVLAEMKAERQSLLRGDYSALKNSQSSGYYYDRSHVDGYESKFTLSALESLSAESFAALKDAAPERDAHAAGKMVYGDTWYLAVGFSGDTEELFVTGDRYTIDFPDENGSSLEMVCERILSGGEGEIIVILSSYEVPRDFRFLRTQSVKITVANYTGYHIPEAALHTVDGVEGVYILKDSTVRFRRVTILYRDIKEGYAIASAEHEDDGEAYLALHDILILSGADLYDGKRLR